MRKNCTMMVGCCRRGGERDGVSLGRPISQCDDQKNCYSWRCTTRKPLRIPHEPTLSASCRSVRMSRFNSCIHAFWPDDLVIAICKSRMYSQSGAAHRPPGWYQASCSVQDSILGSLLDTVVNILVSLLYRDVSLTFSDSKLTCKLIDAGPHRAEGNRAFC